MNLSTKWLPEIPTSWQIANPKTLFSERTQKSTVSDIHLTPSQKFGVLPQSEYMEMTGGSVVLNLTGSDNMKHVEKNDFIIHLRSFQGGIEHSNYSGKVSNAYCVLKPTQQIEPRYFRWVLKSQGYIQELNATTDQLRDGQSIKFEQFASIGLPLPPIEVQRRIADYLDEKSRTIDECISATNRLLALNEEELLSRISNLFAEEPTPDFLLGKVGNSLSLFRAGIRGQAGNTPKSSEPSFWTTPGDGTPWLSIGDMVSRDYVRNSEKDLTGIGLSEIGISPNKDQVLLFAMYASMGKVSFANPGYVWSQAILGLSTNQIDKYFLAAWFEVARPSLKALARSSTQDNLNAEQVMSLRIPVISESEQKEIGRKYKALLVKHSHLTSFLTKQVELLMELKSSLVSQAVSFGILADLHPKEES